MGLSRTVFEMKGNFSRQRKFFLWGGFTGIL